VSTGRISAISVHRNVVEVKAPRIGALADRLRETRKSEQAAEAVDRRGSEDALERDARYARNQADEHDRDVLE
jgi:hypothetical protein